MRSKRILLVLVGIVLICNCLAAADDQPVSLAINPPPHRPPLMNLLDQAGLAKPLDDAGINIYGHVEAGWTWNFDDPSDDLNPFRIFDFEHNKPILDQLDFTVERAVDYRKNKFDVGFKAEMMYGADAGIIHSNGLFDWYDGVRNPKNQGDLTQAYVDVVVPGG